MSSIIRMLTSFPCLLFHPFVDQNRIQRYRDRQLHRLVTHAYNYVPYYNRLFSQAGIKPDDIRTVDDLKALPITSKKDIQQLPENEIVSRGVNPENLIVRKTSGASGEMTVIRRTWLEERLLQAFRHRAMHSFGQRMGDRVVSVDSVDSIHPSDNQILFQIANAFGLYRKFSINCRQPLEKIYNMLIDFRPDILTGFPGVLSQLARITADSSCRKIKPRFIVTDSEVLTPLMRKLISESFSAPVFNIYDSHEFNLIAWECPETGEYHVNDDGMVIEILQNGKPVKEGERGEVVGTNLHSFAAPFIRYRLGDIATKGLSACHCGKPFSTIRSIQGRMLDYFPLPGGGLMHPYEILAKVHNVTSPWIRQYQLLQDREDRIVMRVVPIDTFPTNELAEIEKEINRLVGKNTEFYIRLVDKIDFEQSGKFRVSRSLVRSDYDDICWNHQPCINLKNSILYER